MPATLGQTLTIDLHSGALFIVSNELDIINMDDVRTIFLISLLLLIIILLNLLMKSMASCTRKATAQRIVAMAVLVVVATAAILGVRLEDTRHHLVIITQA